MSLQFARLIFCLSFATFVTKADYIFLTCTSAGAVNVTRAAPSASQIISCPQFNSNLGTLTQYSIATTSATGGFPTSGSITAINTGSTPLNFPPPVYVLTSISGGPFPGHATALPASFDLPLNILPVSPAVIGVGQSYQFQIPPGTVPYGIVLNSSASLAAYVGLGSISIPISFSTTIDPAFAANFLQVTDWSLNLDAGLFENIIYAYTPVPEPSTYGLSTAGLCVMATFLRRKQK